MMVVNAMPKISVVLPVFNAQDFLIDAVQSVLDQTFSDFELLLIEDGSTDNSLKILKQIKDDRVRLIEHKENQGLVSTLNEGIRESKGEYIIRMDADDVCKLNRFELQVEFMDARPDVGISGSWLEIMGHNGEKIWRSLTDSDEIKAHLIFMPNLFHPTVIIRRKLLIDNNLYYREGNLLNEDYDLWIRMIQYCEFGNIPKPLLQYRQHEINMETKRKATQTYYANIIRVELFKNIGIVPSSDEIHLHTKVVYRQLVNKEQRNFLGLLERWFEKILNANKKTGIFNTSALQRVIIAKWFEILETSYITKKIQIRHVMGCSFIPKKTKVKYLFNNIFKFEK